MEGGVALTISRNPVEYLKRKGLVSEPARPRARLDLRALRVHTVPLSAPKPQACVLEQFEGDPAPDRGTARPWPGETES